MTAGLEPHPADRMFEAEFLWRPTFSDLFLPYAGPGAGTLPGGRSARNSTSWTG